MSLQGKRWAVVVAVLAVLGLTTVVVYVRTPDLALKAYWTTGVLLITYCLMAFVIGRRYRHLSPAPGRVLAIVPSYNEDRDALHATVRSLLTQTRVPDAIYVIDDGSAVPVESFQHPRVVWMRQENTGKRGAQCTVLRLFEPDEWDFVLTVDSDSAPYPDAVEELLRAMSHPKVQAATGMIYVRNHGESWVSTAADLDIGISCVMMRASRSALGALETTSGALALYRSEILYDNLEAYAIECGTGDDRWLALRALERGDVVAVHEAGVETDMPPTLNGTYRQRLRWARSWWWMLPYVFKNLSLKKILSPTVGLTQLVVTPMLVTWIVLAVVTTQGERYGDGRWWVIGLYVAAYFSVRMGTSALYLMGRPGLTTAEKVHLWAVGTHLATLLNVIWLMPIRYIALFKLFDNRWQTRELTVPPAAHLPHQRIPAEAQLQGVSS